jgi:Tol biopolymer transport system component
MDGPSPELTPQPARTSDDRLDSWKEIAAYLKRDVTTVRRWEKREGMPVHRHVHDKLGSVYAFRSELDAWTLSRNPPSASEDIDAEVPADRGDSPAVLVDAPSQTIETVETLAPATRRPSHSMLLWCAGGVLAIAIGATWWQLARTDYFWGSPLAEAQFQNVTDSGTEQAAALSRDGRFAAFLSERDGKLDVWVTQLGAGRSYNLTRGRFQQLANPSLRTLGFSPDGSLVTFWARGAQTSDATEISVWAAPTLGGQPTPYLEGVAEFDWSRDGSRVVYHTPGPGDPTFVKEAGQQSPARQIFAAAAGLHAHFPLWSRDGAFIYFVQGTLPDTMDVWRIRSTGGPAERITYHNARVSHPVLLNDRMLMYLASDKDGSGPWLHVMDVDRRVPHRIGAALDRYTSLAGSADGQRLVATLATPKGTLWRLGIADTPVGTSAPTPIPLTTGRGFSPRLGPDYLLYVSSKGSGDVIWKLADGTTTELWSAPEARIIGGPEIAPDGRRLAFSADQHGKTLLYVINADGTNARVVTDSLELRGTPAWTPDGRSITSAADVDGTPHLFNISLDGAATPLARDYAVDPVWSPAGDFVVYSGADIGTTFAVKGVTANGTPHPVPDLTLTRGARRLRFLRGQRMLVVMRGDIQHKDLWQIDLGSGTERQLTSLPADVNVRDFDVSPDGREIVFERVQEQSNVVLINLAPRD